MKKKEALLKRVITAAYENVPYYNNIYNKLDFDPMDLEQFEKLPIVCKEDIREYGLENFISEEFLERYRNSPSGTVGRSEYTTGTTGEPIQIVWEEADYYASVRHHWKERAKYGITTESRLLRMEQFKGARRSELTVIRNQYLYINLLCKKEEDLVKIIEDMNEFQPEWIYMSCSRIYILLRIAQKNNLTFPKSIRYIEFIAEPVLPHYKAYIESILQVPTNNMYGCTETNGIGYMCPNHRFHIMEDNVYVETIDEAGQVIHGETGSICVTGYYNTKMPMIRYRLNDRGVLHIGENCSCGKRGDTLELNVSRTPSVFVMDDPNVFPQLSIYYSLSYLPELWDAKEVGYFQMHVASKNNLDMYEVLIEEPDGTIDRSNLEKLFQECMKAYGLPKIYFMFRYVKSVDKTHQTSGLYIIH